MTFQAARTPWGSGVTGGPYAERELCAARESKWVQPESRRVNSTDDGWTSSSAGPVGVGTDQARPGSPPSAGSVARVDARPLKVVYWNVAGINVRDIDGFFDHLDLDMQWDVFASWNFPPLIKKCICRGYDVQDILSVPSLIFRAGALGVLYFINGSRFARLASSIAAGLSAQTSAGEAGIFV